MTNLNPNQFGNGDRLISTTTEALGGHLVETPAARRLRLLRETIDGPGTYDDMGEPVRVLDNVRATMGEGEPIGRRTASVGDLQPTGDHETKPGFYRKSWGTPAHATSQYEYHVPDSKDPTSKIRSHLAMEVAHQAPVAHYAYPDKPGRYWYAEEEDLAASVEAGEPKLFGMEYRPGRSEVYSMFGTKRGATHAATMLGIAARDTAIEHGRTLTPPDDLSPYSSRLVRNLKGKGVVADAAPDTITNDYEHYTYPEHSFLGADDRIPDDEVAVGRSTMRSVLRAGRPRKPRETYTQERLF